MNKEEKIYVDFCNECAQKFIVNKTGGYAKDGLALCNFHLGLTTQEACRTCERKTPLHANGVCDECYPKPVPDP